jgi:sigma-B regulation protein RsbU (phosphoserine phosphatase)
MISDSRLKAIFLALAGVASLAVYLWLFAESKPIQLLRSAHPQEDILAKAEQAYRASPLGKYDWPHSSRVNVDDDLFRFIQASPNGDSLKNKLPIGLWEVTWKGKIEPPKQGLVVVDIDDEKKKDSGHFTVKYDFNGNLIGIEQALPPARDSTNLAAAEALQKAGDFLVSLGVDTSSIKLSKRETSQDGNRTKHSYTFKRTLPAADWDETFQVQILGATVTQYLAGAELHEEKTKRAKTEEIVDTVTKILTPIAWVVICIFVLVIFFRRLRHDELEFKRAAWVGSIIGLAMWVFVAVSSWPDWAGVLIGGGFAGLFTGAGIIMIYAAAESVQRETWKEKLAAHDLLFRGYLRVQETGHAILRAFFIAGVTLLLAGGIFWLATHFKIAFLEIDNDDLWVFQNQYQAIAALSGALVGSLYVGLIFLAFWPSYLRSKISSLKILLAVAGVCFGLSGLHLSFLRPSYLAFAFFLPVALLWAWFVYRHDLLTVLLALLAVNYFKDFSFITLLPGAFAGAAGVITHVLAFLAFGAGVFLVYSKNSVKDFEHYVPAYVSRIAERERFLKELEIARSIQMRFLPAQPPVFPKLDIACLCKPAMEVGGDYYDFIKHDDSRLGVVIGDVSGKGVSAAFFMTMAKGIIKALSRINPSPKSLLSDMNSVFYENTPKEVFISLIYGLFDVANNTLTFARAGHNPLIVRKSVGDAPERLNPRGLAIGLEKGNIFAATIEEKAVPIQKGDVFIFYTDGISEMMNKNGDEFGEERLGQLINRHAHESAATILEKVTHEVNHFAGGANQHDDFTMVVVKVVG